MRLILILLTLTLIACGEESPKTNSLTSATIPDNNCTFYSAGTRLFCNGVETSVEAYDCGYRDEGRRFWYFVHHPDSNIPGDEKIVDVIGFDENNLQRECQ